MRHHLQTSSGNPCVCCRLSFILPADVYAHICLHLTHQTSWSANLPALICQEYVRDHLRACSVPLRGPFCELVARGHPFVHVPACTLRECRIPACSPWAEPLHVFPCVQPTNHLDALSVAWLETFLASFKVNLCVSE